MTQNAIVEGLTANGDATIRVYQKSACGHDCSDCGGICGAKKSITVQARNPLRARPGDTVIVETMTGRILRAAVGRNAGDHRTQRLRENDSRAPDSGS